MTNEDVLRKIRGILARAERGSTEEERDTAMKMAEKFLFKHNLSMADIGDIDQDPGREFTRERDNLAHWSGNLLFKIAPIFFCKVYYVPTSGKTAPHVVMGRKDNVRVVRELHAYLAAQIEMTATTETVKRGQCPRYARVAVETWAERRNMEMDEALADLQATGLKGDVGILLIQDLTGLAKSYAAEVRPFIKRGDLAPEIVDDLGVWRRSFIDGMITKIYLRLHKAHRESVKEAGTKGTDLVVNEKSAMNDYMKSIGLELGRASRNERQHDHAGAAAGSQAGERADISMGNKMGRGGARLLNS